LDGGKKTGADIACTMNRLRYRLPSLGQDVEATVYAVENPPGGPEPCADFFASHVFHDRSIMIYMQVSPALIVDKLDPYEVHGLRP